MEQVQRYIAEYHDWFYLVTVLWTFLEGETFIILAAAVASQGLIDPLKLGLCAIIGSFSGDTCWFFLGRYFGHIVVRRFPEWKKGIDRVHGWLEKWDVLFILSFRFLYGVRNFSSAAVGLSDYSAPRFLILNCISAVIWAVTFVSIGFFGGRSIERVLGRWTQEVELTFLGLFVLVIFSVWVAGRLRTRRAKRRAADMARLEVENRARQGSQSYINAE